MLPLVLLPFFTLASPIGAPSFSSAVASHSGIDAGRDEVDAEISAAGNNVAALLDLATVYERTSETAAANRVFERILELDSDQKRARKALGHRFYDDRWFESYVELAKYKREVAARRKEEGLVDWKGEWVAVDHLPYLRMGWVQDQELGWIDPDELVSLREAAGLEAAGHKFRADDSSWVAPADFDKWTATQWKCGDEWFEMEAADAYHSNINSPWKLTGEHFVLLSSCSWNYANAARWHADQVHAPLLRLFGVAPPRRPEVLVLRSLEQYNVAASGALLDSEGLSSLLGAYFCDAAQSPAPDPTKTPALYLGKGVSYWEASDERVAGWGPYWVRWAAAQSFVDAIDFSWEAVSRFVGTEDEIGLDIFRKTFWAEKRIPRWLRFGAASYVERFLANPEAGEGSDPWDLRAFALKELAKNGGLRKLSDVFAFKLSLEDIPGSTQLYYEAGLLVSFLLDGAKDDAPLQSALDAFRTALKADGREAVASASKKLEAELLSRDKAIRAYAGL